MFNHILVLVSGVLFISCATPIGPDGGPRDQQGPKIVSTVPESGTTNFKGRKITISFDEFVRRENIRSQISIEPDIGIGYVADWKRKDLIISFNEKLPDSTTVIVTLSNEIQDTKANKMGAPETIAFSTGDEIDEGSIKGKILNADNGKGIEGASVLLYRSPADLTKKATYIAKTDTGGVFSFKYLGEGTYKAVYVEDRNRNKIWEKDMELARSFYREFIELGEAESDSLNPIYINKPDTVQPELLAVGMLSTNRLRLRFSEGIILDEETNISLTDTTGTVIRQLLPLYIDPKDDFILYAFSDSTTNTDTEYSVNIEGVTDIAGNPLSQISLKFNGSSQTDTTLQRVIGQASSKGLFPDQPVEVVYADLITDPEISDSLVVVEGEVTFKDWPSVSTAGNRLFVYPQEDTWLEGMDYQFLIWNPATRRRKLVEPEIWDEKELGAIELRMQNGEGKRVNRAFLRSDVTDYAEQFELNDDITTMDDLAPVTYTLFVFTDLNDNGVWDQGSVIPYESPEPYIVRRSIRVSSGFISEVFVEL